MGRKLVFDGKRAGYACLDEKRGGLVYKASGLAWMGKEMLLYGWKEGWGM